jgi:outer membrane protein OmpU
MKNKQKGEIMNNFKKVGLTALAGSLAVASANAAEMSVSGATLLTYTSEDTSETTGNPFGMKTNLAFTASGEVNGYTVSYLQVSKDQFAGMSSARLSVDMGDMGTLAFDQGSGSGLATIDDKTPTAAEEIWDGIDTDGTSGAKGLVGAAGSSGVFNYINTFAGITFNGAARKGSGAKTADGGSSGAGQSAWDFALTGNGDALGVDGLAWGTGYGLAEAGQESNKAGVSDNSEHWTVFANYSMGPVTLGYQMSGIQSGANGTAGQNVDAYGIAFNINENLSVSYGERDVEFDNPSAANVTEKGEGIAVAYTMGSMKIAGNRNEVRDNDGTAGSDDQMTEIALSFAF